MQSCNKRLSENLNDLKLKYILENHQTAAQEAAKNGTGYTDFLDQLIAGEANQRYQAMIERRIRQARLPLINPINQLKQKALFFARRRGIFLHQIVKKEYSHGT